MISSTRLRKPVRSTRLGALLIAIAFGVTGLIFALHKLAAATLRHIVTSDSSLTFQEISDSLPVPRKLDWNLSLVQTLIWERDTAVPIITVGGTLLIAALCGFYLWVSLRDAAAGAVVIPNSAQPPPDSEEETRASAQVKPAVRQSSWVLPTLLYMVCILLLLAYGVPPVSQTLLRYYHTMGTFHQGYWLRVAIPALASSAAIWSAAGMLLYAVTAARRGAVQRGTVAVGAAMLFGMAFWCQRMLNVQSMASRHDWNMILTVTTPYVPDQMMYGVPDGYFPAQRLGKLLNLKFGEQKEQPARPVVLFFPNRAAVVQQLGVTEDGLAPGVDSIKPVRDFLERRNFETALSWTAIKHLFNVATVHFDTTGAIDACMTDMERCPHLTQTGLTTKVMMFTCAASTTNLALMDRWADERLFAHPTRESKRLMGQLYERFGETDKALLWYRRAEMPVSFLARVQNEKPLFHNGRITGRIVLNGKPLAGIQVGVVPGRLNGLPPDLEATVLGARSEVLATHRYGPFPMYYPRPYSFRWISASALSDSAGNFNLTSLTEGEYMLVCTLPPAVRLQSPIDPFLSITNSPTFFVVNYSHPSHDLGTISLKTGR